MARRHFDSLTLIALTAALVVFTSDARAGSLSSGADGIAVKYSQEELNNSADAENLYRKLKQASRKACGLDGGFLNLQEHTRAQKCYDETLAEVVRKIDRPLLTSLHESKTSKVG
jgi:UrcA family protein